MCRDIGNNYFKLRNAITLAAYTFYTFAYSCLFSVFENVDFHTRCNYGNRN